MHISGGTNKSGVHNVKILSGRPRGTTHPPTPPNAAPLPTKRVPFCSFLNSAFICIKMFLNYWVCKTL